MSSNVTRVPGSAAARPSPARSVARERTVAEVMALLVQVGELEERAAAMGDRLSVLEASVRGAALPPPPAALVPAARQAVS